MTTLEQLEQLIGEYKEVPAGSLKPETTFAELELDSLDVVDLTMACEDKFGVSIEMNEDLKSIGDLIAILDAGK